MKTCGYCGRTYDDSEQKCPGCGSTLLKHSHVTDSAAADYDRIKREIEKKRKQKSKLLAGIAAAVVLLVIIIVVSTIARGPQRRIDSNARDMYESALRDYNAGNYDSALSTLGAIDSSWSDYRKAADLRQQAVCSMLSEKAGSYMATGNYEAIIQLVTSNVDNVNGDAEIKRIYDSAVSSYRDKITEEAEQAFQSSGYEQALAIVNRGLSVLNGDAVLLALKSQYEAMAPVALVTLKPFSEYPGDKAIDVTLTDKLGNTYTQCIEFINDYDYAEDGTASRQIYVLNYAYSSFSGTIFVPESRYWDDDIFSDNPTWHEYLLDLKIYGDGRLLYTSPRMSPLQYPVNFDIDISGVDQLAIEWQAGNPMFDFEIGIANAYLYK